jgi:DNA-binding MarR family transcriptional regulator
MTEGRPIVDPPRRLVLERFMPFKIAILSNRFAARFAELYGQSYGLSVPDWRVLAVVAPQPGVTAREVVELTNIDKTQVSRAVARMIERKLMARRVNVEDRRLQHLYVTPAGLQIYDALAPQELEMEDRLMGGLTDEEGVALHALLDRLVKTAETL